MSAAAACASSTKMPFGVTGILDTRIPGINVSSSDETIPVMNHIKDNVSVVSDDNISVSSDDDIDERPAKVVALGKALQKKILKGCIGGENVTSSMIWQQKIKKMMIDFVRMFLYDYDCNSYFYIRGVLLDCKGMIEDHDLEEQKEFLLKGLKLIKEKSIQEDIPFCGAGGFEY